MYILTVIDPKQGDGQLVAENEIELAEKIGACPWDTTLRVIVTRVK